MDHETYDSIVKRSTSSHRAVIVSHNCRSCRHGIVLSSDSDDILVKGDIIGCDLGMYNFDLNCPSFEKANGVLPADTTPEQDQ